MAARGHYTDHFSDEDDDNDDTDNIKTSVELAQHDRELLNEEEEQDRILMRKRNGKGNDGEGRRGLLGRWQREDSRGEAGHEYVEHDSLRSRHGGQREYIYKLEEGGSRSTTPSSTMSDLELEKPRKFSKATPSRRSRLSRCFKFSCLNLLIVTAFIIIGLGAYRASHKNAQVTTVPVSSAGLLSNGSSLFAATTILISLDGYRADFLNRGKSPVLHSFVQQGVSPEYMLPSFPSVTFPNHFTLVTGLYPESHGVVGNTFWDPELKEEFYYTHPDHSMQPKWWQAEPLWVTAEDQGIKTAIHMWPGSEAHLGDVEPTFLDKFNGHEDLQRKAHRILELLDLPGPMDGSSNEVRPQFIAAYVPNVDQDGHLYGPNSTEILDTLQRVDDMLGTLFEGLEQRNLTEIINIVIVSDHGMASTSIDRLIQIEDLIDLNKIERIEGWPHFGLRPKNEQDLQGLYIELREKASNLDGFDVYLRDKDMPRRYHFSNNERIAPLWIMPRAQWAIVSYDDFNVAKAHENNEAYHPRGIHGYDNEHPLMRSIFVARGPAFPHIAGSKVPVFQNTEVYNILCDTLGIKAKPNNGTLRLPFSPVGLHSFQPEQTVVSTSSSITDQLFGIQTIHPNPPPAIPPQPPTKPDPPVDVINDPNGSANKSIWDWMLDSLKGAKEWAGQKLEDAKDWASEFVNTDTHDAKASPVEAATGSADTRR